MSFNQKKENSLDQSAMVSLYPHWVASMFAPRNPKLVGSSVCNRDRGDEHHGPKKPQPAVSHACGRDHGDEHHDFQKPRSHL